MYKDRLDQLMREYYYEKNSVEDILWFLDYMIQQYIKVLNETKPIIIDYRNNEKKLDKEKYNGKNSDR